MRPSSSAASRAAAAGSRHRTYSTQETTSTSSVGIPTYQRSAVYDSGKRSTSHTAVVQHSGQTGHSLPEQKMDSARTSAGYMGEYAASQPQDTLYEQLSAMHQQKERALMKSVNHLKQKVAFLQAAQREDKRSRYIQKLTKELRNQQKTNEILRRNLTTMTEMTSEQIDDMLLRKGIGAPKRFATETSEEDQEMLAELKQRCTELEEHNKLLLQKNEELSNALHSNYRSKVISATSRGGTLPNIRAEESGAVESKPQQDTTPESTFEKTINSAQTKTLDFTTLPSLFPQDEIEKLEQELSEKEAKLSEQYEEIDELKRQAESQTKSHEKLKNKYQELKQNKRKEEEMYERKLYYSEQKVGDLEAKLERYERQISSLKHQVNANEETIKVMMICDFIPLIVS
eukprot:gb/GECG01003905.1/.p1 GENE.gb/GECG01003905.1/~~gb/GECG01003905.1/.p1  ORF type:complete len:401 (+),score=84.92 gb/GECG01003905.1/:1-1203(+)